MTLEQINNLTVNDVLLELLHRVIPDLSSVPYGIQWYWFEVDKPNTYETLELYPSLAKPPLKDLEEELLLYKSELLEKENERLRKEDLYTHWGNICKRDRGIPSYYQLIRNDPNAAAYMLELIENKLRAVEAETLMQQLEAKDILIIKENTDRKKRDDLIAIGRKEKEMCDNVQFLLAGYVTKVMLTEQQKTKLKADFKVAKDALDAANPEYAKTEIEKLQTDAIVTPEVKEMLLKEFAIKPTTVEVGVQNG